MKVVVTGALGHIGSALIRMPSLVNACDQLVLIDDMSTQRFASLFNLPDAGKYSLIEGNVLQHLTPALVADASAVVHLAGMTDASQGLLEKDVLIRNNLGSTRHATEVCLATGTPLVFVSSTSVYTSSADIVDEACLDLNPASTYAQCKLLEEQCVLDASHFIDTAVFRLGSIFGPSIGMRFHTAINRFCWQVATGQPVSVWSTAMDQLRPYLALSDATAALTRVVLESIYPDGVVNLVSCNATVRQVLETISDLGYSVNVAEVESPIMNSLSYVTSTCLARKLGFRFEGDLRSGISGTLEMLSGLRA